MHDCNIDGGVVDLRRPYLTHTSDGPPVGHMYIEIAETIGCVTFVIRRGQHAAISVFANWSRAKQYMW